MNPRIVILLLGLGMLSGGSWPVPAQGLIITEFNARGTEWIELFNPGTVPVDLRGWSLTDDPANLTKWTFPGAVTIGPHEFYVVRPRTLRLAGEGDYLALVEPDGETIATEFAPQYPYQPNDKSYGFPMDGLVVWTNKPVYMDPTPGEANPSANYYGETPRIALTELMYHPATSSRDSAFEEDAFEFVEFKNAGSNTIDLAGCSFLGAFFSNQILAAGERALLVANRAAFVARYGNGLPIVGEFYSRLANEGESLIFWSRDGAPVFAFSYKDSWHPVTDGHGFSLVPVDEEASPVGYGRATAWRPSSRPGGSPGQADPPPIPVPPILVNEVLSRPEPPFEDAIELYNPTGAEVDVSRWWLTDDLASPKKFSIPEGTFIPANGFLALDEHTFNWGVGPTNRGFSFREEGEGAYLFSADTNGNLTGYVHGFEFGGAEANVTFGRYVTSTGEEHFVAQSARTFYAPNAGPKVGPVVISEIHYQPSVFLSDGTYHDSSAQYIELVNITGDPVPLDSWELRNAVWYKFPAGTVIPPGGHILVVGFSVVGFSPALHALIYGPWSGRLKNSGESVELVRVDRISPERTAAVLMDKVSYSSLPPWPAGANGMGASLQRIDPRAYGDDPANWRAALKSPGMAPPPDGSPPVAVLESQDTFVAEGSNVTFSVAATGTSPLHFQWLLNGRLIPGEVNSTLHLVSAVPTEAGRYSCWAFNPFGAVRTGDARLTVIPPPNDTNPPSLSITSPAAPFVSVSTNRLTLAGTASDDTGIFRIFIQHNSDSAAIASGTAEWSATAELIPGANHFQVVAMDWRGNASVTNSITAYWGGVPLWFSTNGAGSVTGPTNGQLLIFGERYTLTAVPARGNVFLNWTDLLGGIVSTEPRLSFIASRDVSLVANFVPDPFPGFKGTYAGLFYRLAEPAHDNAGYFTITVGRRGGYTGWLRRGNKRHALNGRFDFALSSRPKSIGHGADALEVKLQFIAGLDAVTGSVSNAAFVSELAGERVRFGRTNPAMVPVGIYSVSFVEETDPDPVATSKAGWLMIRANGQAAVGARLSDGARILRDIPLTGERWLPLHAPLYRNRGSIFGWLSLANTASDLFVGSLLWTKKTAPGGSPSSIGFTNRVEMRAARLSPAGPPTLTP